MNLPALVFLGIDWSLILGASLLAMLRGGSPEKIAAIAFASAMVGSWASYPHDRSAFNHFMPSVALADLCLLVIFLVLSTQANRFWPVVAAIAQTIACLAHLGKFLDPAISAGAYSQMEGLPIWPISVTLVCATIGHRRRLRLQHVDPSWSNSLPLSARAILSRLRLD